MKPGLSFRELTERLRPLSDEFVDQRYGVAMHGVGLCDEYPAIRYPQDWDEKGYDGVLKEGMVMCVEVAVQSLPAQVERGRRGDEGSSPRGKVRWPRKIGQVAKVYSTA